MSKRPQVKAKATTRVTTKTTTTKREPRTSAPQRVTILQKAPVAQGRQNRMSKPMMVTSSNGDCRIHHREYLKDLTAEGSSPSLFKSEGLPINPGMSQTFPWLSQIAPRFEKYQFEKLEFQYETEAPTSLGGSLILTVDYDASDDAPSSKVQAMAYKNAVRAAPWEECRHRSDRVDLSNQKSYFVRSTSNPAGTDIKLYDTGTLFVCSQNVQLGGATLGELYVEYIVHLRTPQLQLPSTSGVGSTKIISGGTESATNIFGTVPTVLPDNSYFTVNTTDSTLTCVRGGNYAFSLWVSGGTIPGLIWSGSAGATVQNSMNAATVSSTATILQATPKNGVTLNIGDTIRFNTSSGTVSDAVLVISVCSVF